MEINQSEDRFVIFDAEKMRKFGILNLGGTPVYGADEKYIFYYDETNNIRKLGRVKLEVRHKPPN